MTAHGVVSATDHRATTDRLNDAQTTVGSARRRPSEPRAADASDAPHLSRGLIGDIMIRRLQLHVWQFALVLSFALLHGGGAGEAAAQTSSPTVTSERLGTVTPSVAERGVIGSQPGTAKPGSAPSRIGASGTSRSVSQSGGSIRSGSITKRSGASAIERGPAPASPGPGLSR